jgi:hypothetical protein
VTPWLLKDRSRAIHGICLNRWYRIADVEEGSFNHGRIDKIRCEGAPCYPASCCHVHLALDQQVSTQGKLHLKIQMLLLSGCDQCEEDANAGFTTVRIVAGGRAKFWL